MDMHSRRIDTRIAAVALYLWKWTTAIGNERHQPAFILVCSQCTNGFRHGASNVIVFNAQFRQISELATSNHRYRSSQHIVKEIQVLEIGGLRKVGRYRAF